MSADHGAVLEWGKTERLESRGRGKTTVRREGASLREQAWRCDRWMQRAQTRKSERERGAAVNACKYRKLAYSYEL